ncbi:ATP-dependent Clp protease proteolytic subunit [Pseudochrobactrum saccharolyticum]|uniref:ATP-dependent Clp protease protease subunit n=1 Tax=Pseudochrobactrum saccharolyticum TaxID=354352 RepID=A0A7W8EQD1_9HYPH|nr:ATP-dependent Clp protease proteolytic subunit [Pseudochrobactrum saccharolyticum]KAB0537258.1 peptidase S14 [Pseudochrobactrum saccharolyticum]MBB5092264.1 ATP-dependent Clp protease protease subunit [Pseudochrobactrum saccharolyticum]MDP8252662.1 ATP-dependent Clp protease proteolytic subunit [Pseudochrobactrum saccharolyticum]
MRLFTNLYRKILFLGVCVCSLSVAAHADVNKVYLTSPGAEAAVKVGKIYFTAEVNADNISNLARVLDELNISYKNLETINLYISSYGGDMDSGYVGYWLVKGSRIPVATVNISTVGSAASMIFCGAENRQSLQGGRFILHPASITRKSSYFSPDVIEIAQSDLAAYNQMFKDIYKKCTKFRDDEVSSLLAREAQRQFLLPEQAMEKGIISKIADDVTHAQVVYYITDSNKK